MTEGTSYQVTITGYASQGEGVARIEGRAVFVKGALAGETCQVLVEKVGKQVAWARVTKVLTPSPHRITPDCPYFGTCGGCGVRHMDYQEELAFKRERVTDALARIGGIDTPLSGIIGAKNTERYRNKVQFPVGLDRTGLAVGFFRAKSHQVVDVADCKLQPTSAAHLRGALKAWMTTWGVTPYEERTGKGLVRHLFVRENRTGQCLCCVVVNGATLPHEAELVAALVAAEPKLRGVVVNSNTRDTNVILGDTYRKLWGEDFLEDVLCGLTFRLSVPSFYQVNPPQTEVLYGLAAEYAGLTGGETVVDLYCGVGTIGLTMAGRAGRVLGAEIIPQAVADARENARRNGITNAEFFCADAGEMAEKLREQGVRPHVVTLDPPRKGLTPQVIDAVVAMAPDRIVYVSCDPGTLARDLKLFAQQGYQTTQATAVDLFPRTSHVECVVKLCRVDGCDNP